jgi:hypothetical protein
MSTANPLKGLPGGGVFPLEFSPAMISALGGKPDKKPEELVGLKCTCITQLSLSQGVSAADQ